MYMFTNSANVYMYKHNHTFINYMMHYTIFENF